jgi:hypothetical protein
LVQRFLDLRKGIDNYSTTWNVVVRRPFTNSETQLGDALGIFDVSEEKTVRIGYVDCALSVQVEFFHKVFEGDEPSIELNRMMLDVQRAMRSDITCGGLSINIEEIRNHLDIEGPTDRLVAGVVEWKITYRHSLNDPSVAI